MISIKSLALSAVAFASLTVAQDCFPGSQGSNINSNDFNTLVNNVQNNNLNPPVSNPFALDHTSSHCFTQGSAGISVENDFVFENTHVFLSDVASGAQSVFGKCNAQGGSTTIHGDSGLSLKLSVFSPGTFDC